MTRLWILAAVALGGCGLVDSDITDFSLDVGDKELTVDAADWQLQGQGAFPAIPCASDASLCADAVAQVCMAEACSGSCDGTSCMATVRAHRATLVNLLAEHPELEEIDRVLAVTITAVDYTVSENTLNIDTPQLTVYAAPLGVEDPADPQAQVVGTIAPVAAGETVAAGNVDLSNPGRDNLGAFMTMYRTPFNIIVGAEILIEAGTPIPEGALTATVSVTASAGL